MGETDDIQRALDVAIAAKLAAQRAGEEPEVWAVDVVEDEVSEIVTSHDVPQGMTEAERRELAWKHRGEVSDEPAVPITPRDFSTLSRITPVRFDQVTYNAVTAVAAAEEMTASAWIRRAVKRQLDREDV